MITDAPYIDYIDYTKLWAEIIPDICGSPKGRGHARPRNSFSVVLFLRFYSSAVASYVLSYEICNRHIMVPVCPEAKVLVSRDLPQKIITLTGIDFYE